MHFARLRRLFWTRSDKVASAAVAICFSIYMGATQFGLVPPPWQEQIVSALQSLLPWWPHILAVVLATIAVLFYLEIARLDTPKAFLKLPLNSERVKGGIRYFSICMQTDSANGLTGCTMRLEDCRYDDGRYPADIITPRGLERADGFGPALLRPRSPKCSEFLQLDESDPTSRIQINCVTSLKYGPYKPFPQYLDREGTYFIEITVSPIESFPYRKYFKVHVRDGQLRCEECAKP